MMQLAKRLVKLSLMTRKDPCGSEFVQIPILRSIPPIEIFFISVEGLTLDFHMDNGLKGELSGSTAKFPTWISFLSLLGIPGSKEELLQFC